MRTPLLLLVPLLAAAPARAQQTPAADSARVYELHEVEVLPRAQNAPELAAALQQGYPPHLRDAGVGGEVYVEFVVGVDGVPREVRVVSASDSGFAAPTVQAISGLRFSPAQVQGHAVAVRVTQPIHWRIAGAPVAVRDSVVIPDSIRIHSVDSVEVRPLPQNFREFTEALREHYPGALRSTGTRAQVLARFAVDPRGVPQYAQVLESSDARFNAPTLDAVRRLRFQPARVGGQPVWVWMEVPVEWADPGDSAPVMGDAEEGYEISAVTDLPRVRNTQAFQQALIREFPPALAQAGIGGIVHVRFRVEPDGTVSNPRIVRASERGFDEATLRVVRTLTFTPARLNGRPVRVWVELPIHWQVTDTPGPSNP
ncbi:MAG TPA: energy transducer TonB [Longimicrobium sp.]|nr:energy transducer TonB [Longimicrobium sp.]